MPEANQQPDPNRRQTRAANANAHPGRIVMAVRRNGEVIEDEKKVRKERQNTREKKLAYKQAAIEDIAAFENKMALDDKAREISFPRHQTEGRSGACLILNTRFSHTCL
jgi:hypothetical protein